ncbi:hypothetical protein ACX8XK_00080 [Serratia marcescens]|uniref:hypothetical protein n=1 Tax=Serratia marcescens TaxID=615 RepID=UPI003FA7446B
MKERPVIFNSEMVRAILDGRKTQTRRVIANVSPDNCIPLQKRTKTKDGIYTHVMDATGYGLCPFGQVGDRLWVREAYQGPLFNFDQMETYLEDTSKFERPEFCEYRADGGKTPEYYDADDNLRYGWKPSIHMPRWASRITLEITAVRVERLNDISEEDAKAEGVAPSQHIITPPEALYRVGFLKLWQSIYGVDSWGANPWVWVIEFRRVEVRDASK